MPGHTALPNSRITTVSFDVHGTLLACTPSVAWHYHQAAQRHGIDADIQDIESRFLPAFKSVYGQWPVPYGRNESDARAFWDAVIDATFAGRSTADLRRYLFDLFGTDKAWSLLPGALDSINWCKNQGLQVAICSNFDTRVHALLHHFEITADVIVISAVIGKAKPDPAPLHAVAEQSNCSMDQLLHIGDSEREDGGACQAAGCRFLSVAEQELSSTLIAEALQ